MQCMLRHFYAQDKLSGTFPLFTCTNMYILYYYSVSVSVFLCWLKVLMCSCLQVKEEPEVFDHSPSFLVYSDSVSSHKTLHQVWWGLLHTHAFSVLLVRYQRLIMSCVCFQLKVQPEDPVCVQPDRPGRVGPSGVCVHTRLYQRVSIACIITYIIIAVTQSNSPDVLFWGGCWAGSPWRGWLSWASAKNNFLCQALCSSALWTCGSCWLCISLLPNPLSLLPLKVWRRKK